MKSLFILLISLLTTADSGCMALGIDKQSKSNSGGSTSSLDNGSLESENKKKGW